MTANKTAKIQFYEGTDEPVVPEIRLTRSKDGTTGQALFLFEKPQALSSITDGEITGMRMIDNEGEILTREVKMYFGTVRVKTQIRYISLHALVRISSLVVFRSPYTASQCRSSF